MPGGRSADVNLAAWQGAVTMIVVGIAAQIAGAIAFVVAAAIEVSARGGSLVELTGEQLITFGTLAPSLLVTGGTMAGGAALAAAMAGKPVGRALGVTGAPWPAFVAAPIGILALGPTSDALRRLMQAIAPSLTFGTLEQLDAAARSAPLYLVAPLFAFVPGIAEELLFRGAFQRSIRTRWLAILLSGFFFSAYHTDPHHVVAVLPLGFYLAWLGDRTGSVLVPITAHVVNNGTAVIASVLIGGSAETATSLEDLVWVPVGWLVAGAAIAVVWFSTRPRDARALDVDPAPIVDGG